jgi:hypothetical protein
MQNTYQVRAACRSVLLSADIAYLTHRMTHNTYPASCAAFYTSLLGLIKKLLGPKRAQEG